MPSSEQRIASMQINRSSGNMTGDDYLVALVFAYINDSLKYGSMGTVGNGKMYPEYDALFKEARTKFPEYNLGDWYPMSDVGIGSSITKELGRVDASMGMPLQGQIDQTIDIIFKLGFQTRYNIGNDLVAPRAQAYARLKEEARQKEMQREEEAKQRIAQHENEIKQHAAQQERMNNQLALDAYYKNLSENYTANLTALMNQSKFDNALDLSNRYEYDLVSPYSNMMKITQGDICVIEGEYELAILKYETSQSNFVYDNDSIEYQTKLKQDFKKDWNAIIAYKINLANQKLSDQITAKKHDLRNAPNVKQLLSGHDGGRKYSVNVENDSYVGGGYIVSINLSAVNKPIDFTNKTDAYIKLNDDTKLFVPISIDMFGCLFADKRVSHACIQNNVTYLDRFGHKNEVAVWRACMDNRTATRVGNWNDFKQYVGTDMDKLSNVASVSSLNGGE